MIIKNIFILISPFINILFTFFLIIVFLFFAYYQYNYKKIKSINNFFYLLMVIESLFWSFLLIFAMQSCSDLFLNIYRTFSISHDVYLSIGAGIWEEFLFRVMLIYFLSFIFLYLFKMNKTRTVLLAIFFSSILFSFFHYIGDLNDTFSWDSFTLRFIAGLILSVIYFFRGFGIATYTHIFYDMSIIIFSLITKR